jgi:RNA polymerase sigma-70 factor (ECF subfamily)
MSYVTTMSQDAATTFEPLRPRLIRIAYSMLGSLADAEDIVQDAFLRWLEADRASIRTPEGFLCRVVTRLCLDRLKAARTQRETYVGTWLPEPVIAAEDGLVDVTLPLLMALERLSPLERAAFLLHDVFGLSFEEIAQIVGRNAAACRQLARRARAHVRATRPRFPLSKERGLEIASAFFEASRQGDMQRLQSLLAADVIAYADGGGKTPATPKAVVGIEAVMALHASLKLVFAEKMSQIVRYGFINGLPGFISIEQGDILQTTALEIEDGAITGIYVVRNPDKLRHLKHEVSH